MTPLLLVEWSLSVLLAVIVLAVIVSTVRAIFATTTKDGPKPTVIRYKEPEPTPRVIFNSDFTPTPATSELIRRIQRATQTPPTTGEQGNKRNERNK